MKKISVLLVMCGLIFFACNNGSEKITEENTIEKDVAIEEQVQNDINENNENFEPEEKDISKASELAEAAKKEAEQENNQKALELFNESINIMEVPWVLADRARVKIKFGNIESAIEDLSKAINQEKRSIYYQWRAKAYNQLGKEDLRDKDLEEANKLPQD